VAGQVPIGVSRHDFFAPLANGGQQWLYATNPDTDTPLHYPFDTPVGTPPASQCGRVLYSDFHVTNVSTSSSVDYPSECNTNPMTAQEKVLEFMIFDLASCIAGTPPPPPPTCTPKTCVELGLTCGPAGDGCGNVIECGNCGPGMACGAGGASTCGPVANMCTPTTCAALGYDCGYAGDGCGNLLTCGMCVAPLTCGGGGAANTCGSLRTCRVLGSADLRDCRRRMRGHRLVRHVHAARYVRRRRDREPVRKPDREVGATLGSRLLQEPRALPQVSLASCGSRSCKRATSFTKS